MTLQIGPDHYRLNHRTVTFLQQRAWGFAGLRLTHGLLHSIAVRNGNMADVAGGFSGTHQIRAAVLRQRIGLVGQNDNRLLHQAVQEIAPEGTSSSTYDLLSFPADSRALTFRFAKTIGNESMVRHERIVDGRKTPGEPFGYFDIGVTAQCRTLTDLLLYGQVGLTFRRDCPKFCLPGYERYGNGEPWTMASRKWLRSAVRLSRLTGCNMLVGIVQRPDDDRVTDVQVKLVHDQTSWSPGRLYPFAEPITMLVEVTGDGYRYLTDEERRAKAACTRIEDRPDPRMLAVGVGSRLDQVPNHAAPTCDDIPF